MAIKVRCLQDADMTIVLIYLNAGRIVRHLLLGHPFDVMVNAIAHIDVEAAP